MLLKNSLKSSAMINDHIDDDDGGILNGNDGNDYDGNRKQSVMNVTDDENNRNIGHVVSTASTVTVTNTTKTTTTIKSDQVNNATTNSRSGNSITTSNNNNNNNNNNKNFSKTSMKMNKSSSSLSSLSSSSTPSKEKGVLAPALNLRYRLQLAANEAELESKITSLEKTIQKHRHDSSSSSSSSSSSLVSFNDQSSVYTMDSTIMSDNNDQANNSSIATIDILGIAKNRSSSSGSSSVYDMTPSVVWNCSPKVYNNKTASQLNVLAWDDFHDGDLTVEKLFKSIKKDEARKYHDDILRRKQEIIDDEIQQEQMLKDMQENVLTQIRAEKADQLRKQREALKEELLSKITFQKEWMKLKEKEERIEMSRKIRDEQERDEKNLEEMLRIKELKAIQQYEEEMKRKEYKEMIKIEKMKINKIRSYKEVQEIIRLNEEEDRMRYLEGRRKMIEDKIALDDAMKLHTIEVVKQKTADIRDQLQARVRRGNFIWHHGKFGFYDR
jgi:hypothetical protein